VFHIGNLAMVCAERPDVTLWIGKCKAMVIFGRNRGWQHYSVDLKDDIEIEKLIYELNHGSLREVSYAEAN